MIVESFVVAATNTDVLAAPSRLAACPYDGQLTLEFQSSANSAANNMALTLQLPDGSTPIDSQGLPAGVTSGGLNELDKYAVSFPIEQGGHVSVSLTLTGTCSTSVRATLEP